MTSDRGPTGTAAAGAGRAHMRLRIAINLAGPSAFVVVYVATRQLLDGTWGLLGGSVLSLLASWAIERRIAPLPLVMAVLAVISGSLTLLFHSVGFLKLELTIHSAAVGMALLAPLAFGLNPLKAIAGQFLALADGAWRTLGFRLGLLDLAVAALNVLVWRTQSDAVWAIFKFPGVLVLHLLFLASQWPLIRAGRGAAGMGSPDSIGRS